MDKSIKYCLAFCLFFLCVACSAQKGTSYNSQRASSQSITQSKVLLKAGELIGYKEGDVHSFKGIPYAKTERFKEPEPIQQFERTPQMALTYGAVAPQNVTRSQAQPSPYEFMTPTNGTADMVSNESIQHLNVWSNDLIRKKPVVVFFHGGGLVSGASSELSAYRGDRFAAEQDVVFVSVNHRLNILGFLDLSAYSSEYSESGILGIKDCISALKWIQENIEAFGGDPNNVTVIGQSGGAEKVSTLASMKETEDLFDKVVYMSGYYATQPKEIGQENARKLARYMHLEGEQFLTRLKEMSYDELSETAAQVGCEWDLYYGIGGFERPFIDEDGKVNSSAAKRKWLIGTTYSEFNTNALSLITEGQNDSNYLPDMNEERAKEELQSRYGNRGEEILREYQNVYPDKSLAEVFYLNPIEKGSFSRYGLINPDDGLLQTLHHQNVTVYNYISAYRFPYFGGVSMYHSGDIAFWFDTLGEVDYLVKGDEKNAHKVASQMSNALGAFARTSNPSTADLVWENYTDTHRRTMIFDVSSEVKEDFDRVLYEKLLGK